MSQIFLMTFLKHDVSYLTFAVCMEMILLGETKLNLMISMTRKGLVNDYRLGIL